MGVETPYLQMMLSKMISQPLWIVLNGIVTYVIYIRLIPVLEKAGYIRKSLRTRPKSPRPSPPTETERHNGVFACRHFRPRRSVSQERRGRFIFSAADALRLS